MGDRFGIRGAVGTFLFSKSHSFFFFTFKITLTTIIIFIIIIITIIQCLLHYSIYFPLFSSFSTMYSYCQIFILVLAILLMFTSLIISNTTLFNQMLPLNKFILYYLNLSTNIIHSFFHLPHHR